MLNAKQIENMLYDFIGLGGGDGETITEYAEKIYELTKPDYSAHVAAAALENEVTSTLLDMLAATILATLINEEGGGRTNIRFSPGSMQEVLSEWTYTVDMEGMVRNVRIQPKNIADWDNTEPESKLESLLIPEPAPEDDLTAKPQAAIHEYKRPEWVIAISGEDGMTFMRAHDRADASRQFRSLRDDIIATIENRWCLHPDCPSSGCNHDASKRDEVTS